MVRNAVFFNGLDSKNYQGLWEINEPSGNVSEIGGLGDAGVTGANPAGLNPQFLTDFNGTVLFGGTDADGDAGLWQSNGTQNGTTEVGGLGDGTVVDANPGGLDPQYLAYSNGKVFFSGSDANNYTGLWETNGTAQGTTEIGGLGGTGITGANPAGLNPQFLTAFGNEILFAGSDADDLTGLWETNVLTGATTEIGGLHDQNVTGAYNLGLSPSAIAVLNGEALFVGVDNTMHIGLWETDGTTGGTQEIGGLGNDGISGEDTGNEGLDPSELTVFGNYVLFNGADAAGQTHIGLWITDGTAQDTKEIGGVNDAVSLAQVRTALIP